MANIRLFEETRRSVILKQRLTVVRRVDSNLITLETDAFYKTRRWTFWLMYLPMMLMALWACLKAWMYCQLGKRKEVKERKLPKNPSFFWSGLSSPCRMIKNYAKTYIALNLVYNYPNEFAPQLRGIDKLMSDFWLEWIMLNPAAVQNRLRLVTRELHMAISELAREHEGQTLRLLSIASGSAEAVLNMLTECEQEGIRVEATLLDQDVNALEYSKKIADNKGVKHLISTVNANTSRILDSFPVNQFHVVEMVGLVDYKTISRAVDLCSRIRTLLVPGGVFLCGNIVPNPERFFMDWVVLWRMLYKSPEELLGILVKSGFRKPRVMLEPHRIHAIAVGYR